MIQCWCYNYLLPGYNCKDTIPPGKLSTTNCFRYSSKQQSVKWDQAGAAHRFIGLRNKILFGARPLPGGHNLLRKISPETLSAFPTWVECFRTSRLSAINLANREPFPSMLSSNAACGRSGKLGPCFGDNGGINAHTDARCLFGSSSLRRRETSCISVQVKRILQSLQKSLYLQQK